MIRILLIEDNPGDARLIEEMLKETGVVFELQCMDRLSSGISEIKADGFEVVLLDLGLPDCQGLATLEKLTEINPKAPIIVLTGLADEATGVQAVKEGAQDYLIKGQVDRNLLLRSINYAVERKRVEESLKNSKEYIERLNDTLADGIFTVILPERSIEYVNAAAERIFGYKTSECVGRNTLMFYSNKEEYIGLGNELKRAIEQGKDILRSEKFLKRKNGEIFPSEITTTFLKEGDKVTKVISIIRDITDRRQAEERLCKSEAFIRDILQSVDEGFIVIDPEYRIISANRAYCEQCKLQPEDVVGRHCYEVSHHIDKPCFMEGEKCAPMYTFRTGEPCSANHAHYDRENNPVYIETKSFPMKDRAGRVYAVIETQNNITEKRKLEEQLRHVQKMESIGTLAGGIAHDFNNLLNVIIGYAGLMQMKMRSDDPQMPQLKEILAAGDRAAQLTKGLLTFSRKQVMEIRAVNINEIVESVKKMLTRIIGEDIDLKITLSDKNLTVKADMVQIEQVLMNLAANARDAMPQGGTLAIETRSVKIDREFIKTHGYGEPGMYALISVSDTGIGMDEKTRKRIFEPYFTTKEMGRGTGLGLSIVYGIVTKHNGYLHCYSEPGRGTAFRIYIPLVKATVEELEKEEAVAPKGGSETILIAEDDTDVRGFIKTILEGYGYKVIEAVDGNDAVKKFRADKDRIQLLLSDLIMPGKNGKDAYEEIKGIKHDIKAIFISGYAKDIIEKFGIEDGMDFISKPVLPTELLRKVRDELDR